MKKTVKIRYRPNSNGTSSIRLNFFSGYKLVSGKRKPKRLIRTLPFHLITNPKTTDEKNQNEIHIKKAELLAKEWENTLLKSPKKKTYNLDSKIPKGTLSEKWINHKSKINLVSPANKRQIDVIVVGTGLAGASASATLAELGYNVKTFCFQDSPRRAHSIAAQGGINAAKNYQGDGDSVHRLFYDTIKGGDYRSREANVYRLAEVSGNIIDQCVAQGVPFARDYGGLLDNRSFGGVLVSRTFYAKGQTGQQLLLGAYSAMNRQIGRGKIKMYNRHEMMDIVIIDGKARGIITRNLITGEINRHSSHAVVIASGGYGNVFYLSTNAMGSNVSASWKIHKRGALFANPCFTQIHPTCIPVSGDHQSKLTLMSESLRNDGRKWVPKKLEDVKMIREENHRMLSHVDGVLRISQLDKGTLPMDKKTINLYDVLKLSLNHVSLIVSNKNGQINFDDDDHNLMINGNKNHLTNLFINILDNSIKYSVLPPKIDINIYKSRNMICISIKDNGIGMDERSQKLIFKKFYRVQSGNIHDIKGHGLGLTYVKKIIDLHLGLIDIKSKKGIGTTFIVSLPFIK